MARLIVKTDGGTETVDLSADRPVHVGRDPANEVPLGDARGASRKHCQITAVQAGGGQTGGVVAYELSDLGATNKTRVNGKAVDKCVLSSGDVISVGSAELTFEDPQEEERLKQAGSKGVCFVEWITGDRRGEKVYLEGARTTFGRRSSNTVALEDRMSSGHHAEITKDLNGYTLRDLGSTNGTLVNGEPTTEAPLNHGTRIRIGNSRFMFKDPSMKDIEVELSQLDDDEGWGMMGDIDLSRARGSYMGLVVGLLLLGVAAASGYFVMQQADEEAGGGAGTAEANLVDDGDMEDKEAVAFRWVAADEDDPVSIGSRKRGKGLALSLRHTASPDGGSEDGGEEEQRPVLVTYADEFPGSRAKPLRVRASLKPGGNRDASLVVVWRNKADAASGATGLTHTVSLGAGTINQIVGKPSWAEFASIGVRLGPGSSAVLDDVHVTREDGGASPPRELTCPGDPRAYLNASGGVDVLSGLTVLLVGAAPIAQLADGTVLVDFVPSADAGAAEDGGSTVAGHFRHGDKQVPASVRWGQMPDDEGLLAEVSCEQATAVGLGTRMLRAHLEGGLNLLTAQGPRSISAASGQSLDAVSKLLGGDPQARGARPRTLVTLAPTAAAEANTLTVVDALDASLLGLQLLSKGSQAAIGVVTNYEVQSRAAREALTDAERLVAQAPGKGIEKLREVAVLYPFIESVRDRALELAQQSDAAARDEIATYRRSLDAFRVFQSVGTLAALDEKTAALKTRFPSRGAANGILEDSIAEIHAEASDARQVYNTEHAGAELSRLERLANLLAEVKGYEPMAAIFYRTIVERFGHLEGDDSFGRRVIQARNRYNELVKSESIQAAVPALPKNK